MLGPSFKMSKAGSWSNLDSIKLSGLDEIGVNPSVCLSVFWPFVHPSVRPHFCFRTLTQKTVCPIEFTLDREIDHHHS